MWIFSRYGMYSIAVANKRGGKPDPSRVMIRARSREHLVALKKRFKRLHKARIIELENRDYQWRIVAPKKDWARCLAAMAREQTWSNFKNEAAAFSPDHAYHRALHRVWDVMYQLQSPPPPPSLPDYDAEPDYSDVARLLMDRPDLASHEDCCLCGDRIGDAEYRISREGIPSHAECPAFL